MQRRRQYGRFTRPGTSLDVQVEGVGGVPGERVSAAVLNVTVTNPAADGYLTVFPEGSRTLRLRTSTTSPARPSPTGSSCPCRRPGRSPSSRRPKPTCGRRVRLVLGDRRNRDALHSAACPDQNLRHRKGNPSPLHRPQHSVRRSARKRRKALGPGTTLSVGVAGRPVFPQMPSRSSLNVTAIKPTSAVLRHHLPWQRVRRSSPTSIPLRARRAQPRWSPPLSSTAPSISTTGPGRSTWWWMSWAGSPERVAFAAASKSASGIHAAPRALRVRPDPPWVGAGARTAPLSLGCECNDC